MPTQDHTGGPAGLSKSAARKGTYRVEGRRQHAFPHLVLPCGAMVTAHSTPRPGIDYIGVSVGVLVVKELGEVFLAQRSRHASNERGCWETPGGKVDLGETLEEAVRREMREEYGVEIEILAQFPAADHLLPAEGQHWVATTFLARLAPGSAPRIREPHKCDGIGWFPLDALPSPLSSITQLDPAEYRARLREGAASPRNRASSP